MEFKRLKFGLDEKLTLPPLSQPYIQCRFKPECNLDNQQIVNFLRDIPLPLSSSELISAPIDSARYLSEGDDVKTTVELFLNIKGCRFSYLPGDSIGVLSKNIKHEVVDLLHCLGLNERSESIVEISVADGPKKKKFPPHLPKEISLFDLFECCLEIRTVLKKVFIRSLLEYTDAPEEKRRLEEFCSREGSKEYNDHVLNESICLYDLLSAFTSCKPPLSLILEHLPRLMPRVYSIASSPLEHKNRIRIVFNVIKDQKGRSGICSTWLLKISLPFLDIASQLEDLNLSEHSKHIIIPIYLRKASNFRVPEDIDSSLIMIGPGTGLSPFIGFMEHKQRQYNYSPGPEIQNSLYFGCRYKNRDHIYRKELKDFVDNGTLQNLWICFSRDNRSDDSPRHVQDFITKHQEEFINLLLREKTHLFICGDGLNMAKDVEDTIVKAICQVKNISMEDATAVMKGLEKDMKYIKDVWR